MTLAILLKIFWFCPQRLMLFGSPICWFSVYQKRVMPTKRYYSEDTATNNYGLSVSQITMDMFRWSWFQSSPFLIHAISGIIKWVTSWGPLVETAYHSKQLKSLAVFTWGSCYSLVFCFDVLTFSRWPLFFDYQVLIYSFRIFKLFVQTIMNLSCQTCTFMWQINVTLDQINNESNSNLFLHKYK